MTFAIWNGETRRLLFVRADNEDEARRLASPDTDGDELSVASLDGDQPPVLDLTDILGIE